MNENSNIHAKLVSLQEKGYLAASQLEKPVYLASILKELKTRRIIQKYSPRVGQWAYRITDPVGLAKVIEQYAGLSQTIPKELDKVDATRLTGDAHMATGSKYPCVPIRSVTPGAVIKAAGGKSIDVYNICQHGMALYLPVNPDLNNWQIDGTVCLVENQRYFWEAEQVFEADFYIYLQGNFSNRIADWLTSPGMKQNSFMYFGDYDPTGISLFLRLKKRLPKTRFYIPDNFEELLQAYGNKHDLTKQHRDFTALLETNDADIARLRKAFEQTGKTLHQEALLIGKN